MGTTAEHPGPGATHPPVVPTGVLGMILLILCEIMFFAAFISAHQITSAGVSEWPPADQPRLPVAATLINTAFLLLSGILLFVCHRLFRREEDSHAPRLRWCFALALLTGAMFVLLQGREWVHLIQHGLTFRSSPYGSYFYLIVGAHGLHVLAGLIGLGLLFRRLMAGQLTRSAFWTGETFWYFVVLLWPILYVVVYLK